MNTSAFQCSIFIGVMMVVVYSASVTTIPNKRDPKLQLRHIRKEANSLTHQNLSGWVPKVYHDTCTPHFFCLAEKALYNITEPTNLSQHDKFENLRRALHEYNMTYKTPCRLDNITAKYQLKAFLQNVITCTKRVLNSTT